MRKERWCIRELFFGVRLGDTHFVTPLVIAGTPFVIAGTPFVIDGTPLVIVGTPTTMVRCRINSYPYLSILNMIERFKMSFLRLIQERLASLFTLHCKSAHIDKKHLSVVID